MPSRSSKKYDLKFDIDEKCAKNSYENAIEAVDESKGSFMLLIDEYDSLANTLAVTNPEYYQQLYTGPEDKDEKDSPLREFLVTVKANQNKANCRLFITGIAPIFMNGISKLNYINYISTQIQWSEFVGFTDEDVRSSIEKFVLTKEEKEDVFKFMKTFYNGYRFLESTVDVFNPTLVLNFFQKLATNPTMLNIVKKYRDYSLEKGLPTDSDIAFMSDVNSKISINLIQSLLNNSEIAHEIIEKFMFDGDLDNSKWIVNDSINYCNKSIASVISILYFHGVITVDVKKKKPQNDQTRTIFKIPNLLAKIHFFQTIYDVLKKNEKITNSAQNFLNEPNIKNLENLVEYIASELSDSKTSYEETWHARMESVLGLTIFMEKLVNINFQNEHPVINTNPDAKTSVGRCDIFLYYQNEEAIKMIELKKSEIN